MDMYARLREVNNAMLYKQKFSEKYEKCARTSEKLTKQKNALENEISVLKKEIYYIAIIRKEYADGSVDYETSFTDIEDFNESYYCILKCIGKEKEKGSYYIFLCCYLSDLYYCTMFIKL